MPDGVDPLLNVLGQKSTKPEYCFSGGGNPFLNIFVQKRIPKCWLLVIVGIHTSKL